MPVLVMKVNLVAVCTTILLYYKVLDSSEDGVTLVILNANHVINSVVVTTKYYFPVGTASDCLSIGSYLEADDQHLPCLLELRWFQAGNLKPIQIVSIQPKTFFPEKVFGPVKVNR